MNNLDLAKYIIQNSEKKLSNLGLQKTMYFAELDYYKATNKHLFNKDSFEAWQYGPVIPEVYREYRNYGANYIDKPKEDILLEDKEKERIIRESIKKSNSKTSWELVNESHQGDGAWKKTIDKQEAIISSELIAQDAKKR